MENQPPADAPIPGLTRAPVNYLRVTLVVGGLIVAVAALWMGMSDRGYTTALSSGPSYASCGSAWSPNSTHAVSTDRLFDSMSGYRGSTTFQDKCAEAIGASTGTMAAVIAILGVLMVLSVVVIAAAQRPSTSTA